MSKSSTTHPITSQDLKSLHDIIFDVDEYSIQVEIRNLLRMCNFNPDQFRSTLIKVIRNYRNSKYSVSYYEIFKKALYMPFKDLPKAIEDPYYTHYQSVINWRLSTGV